KPPLHSSMLRPGQIALAGTHEDRALAAEVGDRDGAALDARECAVAAVDRVPLGASNGCRAVAAYGPEAAVTGSVQQPDDLARKRLLPGCTGEDVGRDRG